MMQTILGAGGAIGTELAKALRVYTNDVRLVSRNPVKVNDGDELFAADLTNAAQVGEAVKGSEVAYLTAGLNYSVKVWQQTWPVIMRNVINACVEHHCRLVFFDNIYLYDGSNLNPITEETPIDPPNRKGRIRERLVDMIWEAVKERGLVALIARSADFYGPGVKKVSLLTEMVLNPLAAGKSANWLVSDQYRHSFTHTVDAAKATALLGNTPECYGETWHLPTAKDPFTGKEWIEIIAGELGVRPRYRVATRPIVMIMGWFMPIMREMYEMLYQYDKDYVFNSDKFESRFPLKPTPYREGIREIVQKDYRRQVQGAPEQVA